VKSIVDALHMFASDLSQAKDVHNLKIDFDSRPAAEVEWLIRFAAVNCSELLLVSGAAELSRQIVSLRRVLPKSQLAAWCLRPTTTDSLTDGGTKLVHDQALIDPIRLLNFLGPMNVENAGVCLWELSAKLAVFRRQPVGMPQGIPSPIHAALVAALKQYGRASRLSDLKLAVGAENLNLHPLSLPPGRILAYAPSPKFLRRESAYYILSDWVADEERRRGKIRADRVVTPLIPVDWPALQLAMNVALKADDIYAHLGIAWLTRIANSVLKQLKYNPLNPYLKTCATQMLRKQLRHNHTWVGRGIFLGPRWSELAMSSQHISDLRLKVAQELKHEQHKVAPDVVEELTSQLIGKASLDR
jgi:hypothetical protein